MLTTVSLVLYHVLMLTLYHTSKEYKNTNEKKSMAFTVEAKFNADSNIAYGRAIMVGSK